MKKILNYIRSIFPSGIDNVVVPFNRAEVQPVNRQERRDKMFKRGYWSNKKAA